MKKTMRRLFAILMTLAIAITAIPMTEAKAAEENIVATSVTLPVETITLDNQNTEVIYDEAKLVLSGVTKSVDFIRAIYNNGIPAQNEEIHFYESDTENVYVGDLSVCADTHSGTYVLYKLEINYEDDSRMVIDENLPNSSFVVENNITDHIAPVIQGAEFEHNGQTFTLGTDAVIEFTAESITDEGGTGIYFDELEGDAYVRLCPVIGSGSRWAYFTQQADGSFKAEIGVNGLTNTEWYVDEVYARDLAYNVTSYKPLDDGQYWHFFVEDANEICETQRNICLNFHDENGDFFTSKTVNATTSEVELATLLDEIPTYTSDDGFVGWRCRETGQMLEQGEMFVALSAYNEFRFYPVYEERTVAVAIYRIDENGERNWTGYEDYLIGADTTYQDLAELLPIPPVVEGCNFVTWEVEGFELTDFVYLNWADFAVVYDKQIIDVTCMHMDEEGNYKYDFLAVIFELDEIVTYADVLACIPQYETYPGVNFVKWEFMYDEFELEEEVQYDWVEVEAVYDKYSVTIERIYVDTTGAIKSETITNLYPAGTTMLSICEAYAVTPSDASSTLTIDSWSESMMDEGEISASNNELSLKAQYADSVIVEIEYEYIAPMDDHGVVKFETIYEMVDKNIVGTGDTEAVQLLNYCMGNVEPKLQLTHYDGFEVDGWEYHSVDDIDGDGFYDYISASSKINIDEVISVFAEIYDGVNFEQYVYVVEAGDSVTLPEQYDGYYMTWYDDSTGEKLETGKYIVPDDAVAGGMQYFVNGVKGDKVPSQDDNPSGGDNNNQPDSGSSDTDGDTDTSVPKTGDSTNVLPYLTLLLLGAGVYMVGNKRRNFVR